MSDFLHIQNFKCFLDEVVRFEKMTIFAGMNGAGKSSIIQALLLLKQCVDSPKTPSVHLNGPWGLALGDIDSVLSEGSDKEVISLQLSSKSEVNVYYRVQLEPAEDDTGLVMNKKKYSYSKIKEGFGAKRFYYLSAERTGPRVSQRLCSLDFDNTGIYGEFTAQILSNRYKKVEYSSRMSPFSKSPFLIHQVNAWLSFVLPSVEVSANADVKMQTAQLLVKNSVCKTYLLSTDIGFGISYVLPIIVTGLIAENNSYFIIENPEAHLHPSAQSSLGFFLCMLANNGLRVIVETHSDHLINGVQYYMAKNKCPQKDVLINNLSIKGNHVEMTPVFFDEKYNYSKWPEGFMDQVHLDYLKLRHVLSE